MRASDLDEYTTIIMPDGNYSKIGHLKDDLKEWIKSGGNLVACKRANGWLNSQGIIKLKSVDSKDEKSGQKEYGKIES